MSMCLAHCNDRKEKTQSHEVTILKNKTYFAGIGIYGYDLSDIHGYGNTQEEALQDFKRKFSCLMQEYKIFASLLFDFDILENEMVEVDCFGNPITKEK